MTGLWCNESVFVVSTMTETGGVKTTHQENFGSKCNLLDHPSFLCVFDQVLLFMSFIFLPTASWFQLPALLKDLWCIFSPLSSCLSYSLKGCHQCYPSGVGKQEKLSWSLVCVHSLWCTFHQHSVSDCIPAEISYFLAVMRSKSPQGTGLQRAKRNWTAFILTTHMKNSAATKYKRK